MKQVLDEAEQQMFLSNDRIKSIVSFTIKFYFFKLKLI